MPGPLRLARLPLAASGSGKISLRGRKHRGAAAASVCCRVALHFPLVPPVSACLSSAAAGTCVDGEGCEANQNSCLPIGRRISVYYGGE